MTVRAPTYRALTVCCVYCGRLFLGETWLMHHLHTIAKKPLWQRALVTRPVRIIIVIRTFDWVRDG